MKILVLYSNSETVLRKTINDHLYCFKTYVSSDAEFHYCNVLTKLPLYLKLVKYDGIIIHYTLLSMRWTQELWKYFSKGLFLLKRMKGVKIAMPQDENAETESLCRLFREHGIDTVYTCAYPIDYQTLYPSEKTGLKNYITTFTGFVDENTLQLIKDLSQEIPHREIDIGYRARSVPFWLGYFGQYKKRIEVAFQTWKGKTPLHLDISTDPKDVFYGDDWLRFLLRCRAILGCLGGASLFDPDGSVRSKVENYLKVNPEATFEEVEKTCFPGQDHSLHLFALSPRHFECAMAKTCQILLEGDYKGVLEPGVHYIELKKDFSNIEEVLNKVSDSAYCKKIAEQAYEKVVSSGEYTYAKFAQEVVEHIKRNRVLSDYSTEGLVNTFNFHLVGLFLKAREKLKKWHLFVFRVFRFCLIGLPRYWKKKVAKSL